MFSLCAITIRAEVDADGLLRMPISKTDLANYIKAQCHVLFNVDNLTMPAEKVECEKCGHVTETALELKEINCTGFYHIRIAGLSEPVVLRVTEER